MTAGLGHVRWLGGSPCAGKSTVAEALADASGWAIYRCDDRFDDHLRAGAERGLASCRDLYRRSFDEIFLRDVATMERATVDFFRDEFPMIVAELREIEGPVVAEGAALMPSLLSGLGVSSSSAYFLVPSEAFQREKYGARAWAQELCRGSSEPERAFDRWMRRDAAFARRVVAEAERFGYPLTLVDGGEPVGAIKERVAEALGR